MAEKNIKSTEQLNLRIPKSLLEDIDIISDNLKVNKSEWIKIKLGELVLEEKNKLIDRYIEMNKKGLIDKKDMQKLFR